MIDLIAQCTLIGYVLDEHLVISPTLPDSVLLQAIRRSDTIILYHTLACFLHQALLDAICLARVLYDSLLGDNARPLPPVCLPGDETSAEAGAPCQSPETESSHTSALATVPSKRSGGQGLKRSRCLMPVALEAYAYEMQGRAAVKMDTSRANTALLHTAAALAPAHGSVTRAAAAATAHSTITKKLIGDGNAAVPTANL